MTRRERMEAENWRRMSVLSEPRLSEAVELYTELGHEVRVLPFDPKEDGCGECDICYRGTTDVFVIYARPREQ